MNFTKDEAIIASMADTSNSEAEDWCNNGGPENHILALLHAIKIMNSEIEKIV